MTLAKQIWKVAVEVAANAEKHSSALQQKLEEIEIERAEVAAKLRAARLAPERLANFRPEMSGNFQCPRCWIDHETWSVLTPVAGRTADTDFFRCHTCHFEFSLPL